MQISHVEFEKALEQGLTMPTGSQWRSCSKVQQQSSSWHRPWSLLHGWRYDSQVFHSERRDVLAFVAVIKPLVCASKPRVFFC